MKDIYPVPGFDRASARHARHACATIGPAPQPAPPRGGPRTKPRILILGTPNDSRRIILALRSAGHCPLWKRVESGGSLTAALTDPSWSWNIVICNAALPSCHFLSALPIVEALAPRATLIALWDGTGTRPATRHHEGKLMVGRHVADLPAYVSRVMAARRADAGGDERRLHRDSERRRYH